MAVEVSFQFNGKSALVTGAAGALGTALTRALALASANVLAVDVKTQALQSLSERMEDEGLRIFTAVSDMRDADSVREAAARAAELGNGSIDLFCNNAGVEGPVSRIADVDASAFREVLDINVVGILNGLQAVLPLMRSGSAVVCTGSTASLGGAAGVAPYVASKHALLGLARTAAVEYAGTGIRVNTICPGPIQGRMMDSLDDGRGSALGIDSRGHREYATPEAVAETVLFLLSDAARLVNGQTLIAALEQ